MGREISSLQEYEEAINEIKISHGWEYCYYRGQVDSNWNIVSSAYRFLNEHYPSIKISHSLLNLFTNRIYKDYIDNYNSDRKNNITNSTDIVFSLQHIGGKTPYIDISANHLVGLYFACEDHNGSISPETDGVVYIMGYVNNKIVGDDNYEIGELHEPKNIFEQAVNRAKKQEGFFLATNGIFNGIINKKKLCSIIIKGELKNKIISELKEKGITGTVIYPDLLGYVNAQKKRGLIVVDEQNKKSILRNIAQEIKNGNSRKMDDVFKTILNLIQNNNFSKEDKTRLKYLEIQGYLCIQDFEQALKELDSITTSKHYFFDDGLTEGARELCDPLDKIVVWPFEQAKCYSGLNKTRNAINKLREAAAYVESILDDYDVNSSEHMRLISIRKEINKTLSKTLVKESSNNFMEAWDILNKENKNNTGLTTDEAELYRDAGEYGAAIAILTELLNKPEEKDSNDYAWNLKGSCYMLLSQKHDKHYYLKHAIECYQKGEYIANKKLGNNGIDYYIPPTEAHHSIYNIALAYKEFGDLDNAERYFKKLIVEPYNNEDAFHEVAYIGFLKLKKRFECNNLYGINTKANSNEIVKQIREVLLSFFKAIISSKPNKHSRNYNDIGKCLEFCVLKLGTDAFNDIFSDSSIPNAVDAILTKNKSYSLDLQRKLREIKNIYKSGFKNKTQILTLSEILFEISTKINPSDAYAYENLGAVRMRVSEMSHKENQESTAVEYKGKALKSLYMADAIYRCQGEVRKSVAEAIDSLMK